MRIGNSVMQYPEHIKTRSIDVTKAPKKIIVEEIEKLKPKFDVLQSIDLHPYDKDHAMVIARYKN